MSETKPERRSPALIATAIALPLALITGLIVAAVVMQRDLEAEPAILAEFPAPGADSDECVTLLDQLPDELGSLERAEIVDPAPAATAAWREPGLLDDPVVLRCGLERPLEFDQAAALQLVNEVQWFEVSGAEMGLDSSTWYAVDRGEYVALTLPTGTGPTPVQIISEVISEHLPQQELDPAPIG
ncbi:DUF3515 domain-containing protein [Hoyosella subflava]|uniref:Uncharacterized protein n=1 Tax=Hoyosella subflava (strain DSM 45089 / JCM 17490 / NBRC 109087 / DQS3-9A1) TaxID=443218 RepID=F6EMR4_HOYSD|nr:DUF3515 domain-containing protein [Hoyosella subflava]AEF41622.1 hypothetical protein AS9A_3177 [Hoyosella subflava DQS3-9A1]